MKHLYWCYDESTAWWAREVGCVVDVGSRALPAPQYDATGASDIHLAPETWGRHILASQFPDYCVRDARLECSPCNILCCLSDSRYLEALVLIFGWGGRSMFRMKRSVYNTRRETIRRTLAQCVNCIGEDHSIARAWDLVVRDLGWSDVLASKYLHFLARSLGYEMNPPVPVDSIMGGRVWREFRARVRHYRDRAVGPIPKRPKAWRDGSHSWEAYNRYMTAILCWGEETEGWSSTEVENTIFAEYSPT